MLTLSSATLVGEVSRKGKPERDLKVRTPNPFLLTYLFTHDFMVHTHTAVSPPPLRSPFELPSTSLQPSAPLPAGQHPRTSREQARTSRHARRRRRAAARVHQERCLVGGSERPRSDNCGAPHLAQAQHQANTSQGAEFPRLCHAARLPGRPIRARGQVGVRAGGREPRAEGDAAWRHVK